MYMTHIYTLTWIRWRRLIRTYICTYTETDTYTDTVEEAVGVAEPLADEYDASARLGVLRRGARVIGPPQVDVMHRGVGWKITTGN